jgi:hypothetical protein
VAHRHRPISNSHSSRPVVLISGSLLCSQRHTLIPNLGHRTRTRTAHSRAAHTAPLRLAGSAASAPQPAQASSRPRPLAPYFLHDCALPLCSPHSAAGLSLSARSQQPSSRPTLEEDTGAGAGLSRRPQCSLLSAHPTPVGSNKD